MRITGGKARGIILNVPSINILRPATDFLRTKIFNILGNNLNNEQVLDCFAGTGVYGLEALSRGANKIDFVENNFQISKALETNIERVCKSVNADIHCCNIIRKNIFNWTNLTPYTCIFFDPPYTFWEKQHEKLQALLYHLATTAKNALLVLEKPNANDLTSESGWEPTASPGEKLKKAPIAFYRSLARL